jgi:hypothetical protein
MATWLKSCNGAVCPRTGEPIKPAGSKWGTRTKPCVGKDGEKCEHLGQYRASLYYASAQCKCKPPQLAP